MTTQNLPALRSTGTLATRRTTEIDVRPDPLPAQVGGPKLQTVVTVFGAGMAIAGCAGVVAVHVLPHLF